jgi:hypothetical protein
MLGKLRLALAPTLPEWFHTSLALGPRGLTTGILPWQTSSLEASLDLLDAAIRVEASDGRTGTIKLDPARPVAEIWRDYRRCSENSASSPTCGTSPRSGPT